MRVKWASSLFPPPPPPPPLQLGEWVIYTGNNRHIGRDFADGLPIHMIKEGYAYCRKPDGYFTTWIAIGELKRHSSATPLESSVPLQVGHS